MKNFTIEELCRSDVARRNKIGNRAPKEVIQRLERVVIELLDPLREILNEPIIVTSGYRCEKLNNLVGGATNSQHLRGEAVDIVCSDNRRLFNLIKKDFLFDQLIDEKGYSWIHLSYVDKGNRKEVLHL